MSVNTAALSATYELVAQLNRARTDIPLFVLVRIENTGSQAWDIHSAQPVCLSYHWLTPNSEIVEYDGVRTFLPSSVLPGDGLVVELQVEPPPAAGTYQLAIELVQENVGWFSQFSCEPLSILVEVFAAPSTQRKVCLVSSLCMPNDAVGNNILQQLHYFLNRGDLVMLLLEYVHAEHPVELRQYMGVLTVETLQSHQYNALMRRSYEFFMQADLFIFHYATPYRLFDALPLVERGVSIIDYHGVTPLHVWNGDGEALKMMLRLDEQLDTIGYADYAIAHSAYTRNELVVRQKLDAERIFQIGYTVPLERFYPQPPNKHLLQSFGLTEHHQILLYVGRLAANKRVDDLVRALAIVRQQHPNCVLLLVGSIDPPYDEVANQVRELASELGVAEQVILTGKIKYDDLPLIYNLATAFVIASVHEGFCVPVIEALSSSVPVIATHTTALPETVGQGGLTFRAEDPQDLANQINKLLS